MEDHINVFNTHRDREGVSLINKKYRTVLRELFRFLIKNDCLNAGKADLSTRISYENPFQKCKAIIIAKESGLIAGVEELKHLLESGLLPWQMRILKKDGDTIADGETLAEIEAPVSQILGFERIVLNFWQRVCGIAGFTQKLMHDLKKRDSNLPLLCPTRKTLWGLIDKKAVLVGGGGTHRLNLEDAIILKENHLLQSAGVQPVVQRSLQLAPKNIKFFEVEAENINDAKIIAHLLKNHENAIIMLDNFSVEAAAPVINWLRKNTPALGIELSGGITPAKLSAYADLNPDIISMGALTNEAHSLDLSLRTS